MARFDAVVLNGHAVLPGRGVVQADLRLKDGRISAVGEGFSPGDADEVIVVEGKLALLGGVV